MWKRFSRWERGMSRWRRTISKWSRAIRKWRNSNKLRKQLSSSRKWSRQKPQGQERMKDPIRLWWYLIIRAQAVIFIMKVRSQLNFTSMEKFNKKSPIMNKMHRITQGWWFKVSTLELRMMRLHILRGNSSSSLKIQFRTKELKKPRKKSFNRDKSRPKHMISP